MAINQQRVNEFVSALRAKFEAKSNKETSSIDGDYSSDNITYPTVKVVKDYVDGNFIKPSSTTGLIKNDGTIDQTTYLTSHQSLDGTIVSVEEQQTPESGYLKTYVVKQGGSSVGSKINIPKDFLVKSATLETCSVANTPVSGYQIGDKYLDFVINTKDNSGTNDHIYVNVKDIGSSLTVTDIDNEINSYLNAIANGL